VRSVRPNLPAAEMSQDLRLAQAAVQSLYDGDRVSQYLGIEIIEAAPGRVRIEMTVRPDMANGHGICHGGIVFAFADSAFAFACNSRGDPMVAAGANIEFLAPTPSGERLTAIASEITRTGRGGIYDVCVMKASGETVAQFRGRCSRLRVATAKG
jgi:acyl-CoA thioesterase